MKVIVALVAILLVQIDNTVAFNSQTSLLQKTSVRQQSLIILNQETPSTTQEKSPYYFARYIESATEAPSKSSTSESAKSEETVPAEKKIEKESKKYTFIKFRK